MLHNLEQSRIIASESGESSVENEKDSSSNDDNNMAVTEHKTAYIYGPARIVLAEKLKSWLDIFIQIIRPQITTLASGNVFPRWNARSMKSCQITNAIQSIFKKAGIDLKITSTSYHKAAVTKVHMDCPDLSGKLAGLMAHNEATTKKYYLLAEKMKASVEASSKFVKLMRTEEANEECPPGESSTEPTGDLKRNKEEGKKNKCSWSDEDLKK
ncbi:Neurofilament medium polypeptide, partial [Paramuricea clavata]